MCGEMPITAEQRRQRERDQRNPAWLAWLADMEPQLERFFSEDVPDMPEDPWSAEAVAHAEKAALRYFQTAEEVQRAENQERADRFVRYIGELHLRRWEARWLNNPDPRFQLYGDFCPAIEQPDYDEYVMVESWLDGAAYWRTGEEWVGRYNAAAEGYQEWNRSGRLPLAEWVRLRDAKKRAEWGIGT